MSIRAVFRVQCDGPGREWLSLTPDYRPGTDILPHHVVAAPTAERACNWPGERAARRAALAAGWRYGFFHTSRPSWLCPACQTNPLGIRLPAPTPDEPIAIDGARCVAVTPSGLIRCIRRAGHTDEHRNGTVDWF